MDHKDLPMREAVIVCTLSGIDVAHVVIGDLKGCSTSIEWTKNPKPSPNSSDSYVKITGSDLSSVVGRAKEILDLQDNNKCFDVNLYWNPYVSTQLNAELSFKEISLIQSISANLLVSFIIKDD